MQIESLRVEDLRPYEQNARVHPPEQVDRIVASIEEFGWTFPLLVRDDRMVIAGHGRLLAAQQMGMETVPCLVASDWNEAQCRAYTVADNRLAEGSSWSQNDLVAELQSLQDGGLDLSILGFSDEELAGYLEVPELSPESEPSYRPVGITVGRLRFPLEVEQMLEWTEGMRELHDGNDEAVKADILDRLGLLGGG